MQILEELEQQYAPHGPEVKTLSQSVAGDHAAARYAVAIIANDIVSRYMKGGKHIRGW
jgi:hypothetical protein